MVSHSRTPARPGQLRPLNDPEEIKVVIEGHRLAVLIELPNRYRTEPVKYRIEQIQDTWIIDDEWWRDPISRQYFRVRLEGGAVRTIFHDRIGDAWFMQRY